MAAGVLFYLPIFPPRTPASDVAWRPLAIFPPVPVTPALGRQRTLPARPFLCDRDSSAQRSSSRRSSLRAPPFLTAPRADRTTQESARYGTAAHRWPAADRS